MNRVIKLRAWAFHKMQDHFEALRLMANDAIRNNVRYVIMQFTGFKDANGVDIYEGDIFSEDYSGFVEWFEGQWHINWGDECRDPFSDYHIDEFCVVGNIYENTELLSNYPKTV